MPELGEPVRIRSRSPRCRKDKMKKWLRETIDTGARDGLIERAKSLLEELESSEVSNHSNVSLE